MSIILSSCFSKSLHTLDIFYPIFLQRLLNLLRLSLLLVPCILLLGLSLILLCLCRIHTLWSFLFDVLYMIFPTLFGCISALGYSASIASLNPGRLSVENINTSSSPLSFRPFNTKNQYLLDSFSPTHSPSISLMIVVQMFLLYLLVCLNLYFHMMI